MPLANMSVFASKDIAMGPDGVHRLIDYAVVVMPGADPSPEWVVISETAQERRFRLQPGLQSPFQVAVWTTDQNVDPAQSWVRCTFRPAHDVGVTSVTSPMSPAATTAALRGVLFSERHSIMQNPADWGLEGREYTGAWWWSTPQWVLRNRGKFEIAVQVGLHYTDGTDPAYCIVDPEMDLDPETR